MLDTIVAFLWNSDMGGHTFVGDEAKEERAQSFIDLIYETADSYISVAAMHDKHWRGLAKALNRPDFLEDKRFKTPELRDINVDDRLNVTQEALRPHTTDDLLTLLEANDVPCAPVLTRTQMRQHPQIHANGIIIELDHPQAGRLRQTRPPAVFSKTDRDAARCPHLRRQQRCWRKPAMAKAKSRRCLTKAPRYKRGQNPTRWMTLREDLG